MVRLRLGRKCPFAYRLTPSACVTGRTNPLLRAGLCERRFRWEEPRS
jgi:hypothetical protein